MKVLLAMDNSAYGAAALQALMDRTWWGDTEFLVMSVVQILVPALNDFSPHYSEIGRIQATDKRIATELAEAAARELARAHPHCPVASFVAEGNIPDNIVQKADEWDADLIVLGSHGRSGLNKFLLGSVAESVLQRAHCSVEIVKSHPEKKADADASQNASLEKKTAQV